MWKKRSNSSNTGTEGILSLSTIPMRIKAYLTLCGEITNSNGVSITFVAGDALISVHTQCGPPVKVSVNVKIGMIREILSNHGSSKRVADEMVDLMRSNSVVEPCIPSIPRRPHEGNLSHVGIHIAKRVE